MILSRKLVSNKDLLLRSKHNLCTNFVWNGDNLLMRTLNKVVSGSKYWESTNVVVLISMRKLNNSFRKFCLFRIYWKSYKVLLKILYTKVVTNKPSTLYGEASCEIFMSMQEKCSQKRKLFCLLPQLGPWAMYKLVVFKWCRVHITTSLILRIL